MTLGEKLVTVRKNAGHKQSETAEITGVSRATLSYYELDGREPNIGFIQRFCEEYGISVAWLLGLKEGDGDVVVLFSGRDETKRARALLNRAIDMCKEALDELEMTQGKSRMWEDE